MTSEDNLAWFWQTNRRYLVGTPKAELKKWEQQIVDEKDWCKVREGLEVKLCAGPNGKETFVLCRSEARQKKEQAMHERFAARIEEGLQNLKRRLDARKKKEDSRSCRAANRTASATKFTRRGALQSADEGRCLRCLRLEPVLVDGHCMAAVGDAHRGMLHPAHQYLRLDSGISVADVHSTNGGGGGFSDPEIRALDSAHLAPQAGARSCAYPGLFPRARSLENSGAVAVARGSGQQSSDDPRRTRAHSEHRRSPSHYRISLTGAPPALCRPARRGPARAPQSARPSTARTASASCVRKPACVVPTFFLTP